MRGLLDASRALDARGARPDTSARQGPNPRRTGVSGGVFVPCPVKLPSQRDVSTGVVQRDVSAEGTAVKANGISCVTSSFICPGCCLP